MQFYVRNLFYNVPARRRFLEKSTASSKQIKAEFHHVDDPPGQRSRLQTVYGNIIVVQLERHGGIAQRHALEFGLDLFRRRGALLQKPPSRRYVVNRLRT